jgi:hypothetical protein
MAIRQYGQYLVADTEAELLLQTPSAGQIGYPMDTKIRLLYSGSSWGVNSSVTILRGQATVNAKSTGATLIYTYPNTSFRFVPLGAHVEIISQTGTIGIAPTISVGTNSTSYNNLFTGSILSSLLNGTGLTQPNALTLAAAITPLAGGSSIYANVTIAATLFTTYTVRIDILGYYET